MKTSILSPAHSGLVPSVCDAEAGETEHDAESGIDLVTAREKAWPPPDPFSELEMKVHWYTFWKRRPRRASGPKDIREDIQ